MNGKSLVRLRPAERLPNWHHKRFAFTDQISKTIEISIELLCQNKTRRRIHFMTNSPLNLFIYHAFISWIRTLLKERSSIHWTKCSDLHASCAHVYELPRCLCLMNCHCSYDKCKCFIFFHIVYILKGGVYMNFSCGSVFWHLITHTITWIILNYSIDSIYLNNYCSHIKLESISIFKFKLYRTIKFVLLFSRN